MHQLLRQNQVRYLDVKPYIRTFSRNNPTELGEWAKEEGGLFEPGTLIFLLEPAKRPPGMSSFARGQQPAEVAQDAFRVKDMCVVVDKIEGKCWVLAISPSAFELRFIDTLFREKSQKAFLEGLDFNYLAAQPRPPLNQAKLKELRQLSTLYSKSGSRRTVAQDGSGPDEPAKAMLAFLGADLSASVGKQVMELGSICNMIFAPESVQENKLQSMVKSCFTPILASDKLKTPPTVATKQVLESQAQMNEEVSLLTQAYLESEAKEAEDYIASQPDIENRSPAAPTPEEFKKLDVPSPEPPPGFDIVAFSPQPSKELLGGQPASLDAAPDIPMILTGEHQVVTVGDTKNGQSKKVPSLPAWYMTTHDVGEMNQVAIRRTQISPSMPEGLDKLETELSYDALPVVDTRFRESQETPEPVNPAAISPAEAAKPTFSEQFRADYDKGQAGQAAFPSVSNLFETAAPFIQEEPQEPVAWPTSDSSSTETSKSTEVPKDFVDSIFQEGGARSSLETNPDARESQIERRRRKPVQPGDWQPLSTVREPEKEDWSKDEPKGATEAARPTMDLPVDGNLFDKLAGQTSDELGQIIDQPPGWGADESSPGGVPTNLKDMLTVDSAVFSTAQPNAESGPAAVESVLSEISPSEPASPPADATNSSASDADESPDPWTKLPTKSDDRPVDSTGWQPPDSLDEVVPAAQGAAGWSALSSEGAAAEPAVSQSTSEEAKNPGDQENYKELAKALNGLMDSEAVESPAPIAAPPEDERLVDPEEPPVETPKEDDISPAAPAEESAPAVSLSTGAEPEAETAELASPEEATSGGASLEAPAAPTVASETLFPRRSVIEDDEPSPPPLATRAGGSLFPTPTSSQAESLFPRPAELAEEESEVVPYAVLPQPEAANPPLTLEEPEASTVEPILGDTVLPPQSVDAVMEVPLASGAVSSPSMERAEPVNPAALEPPNPSLIDVPPAPTAADEPVDEPVLAGVEKVESVELPPAVDPEPVKPESITTDSYLSGVERQVMPSLETDMSDSVIDNVLDLAEAEPTKEADEIPPTDDEPGREMTQDLDKAILQRFNRGDKTLPQSVAEELRFAPEEEAVAQAPLTVPLPPPPPVEQPAPVMSEATLEIEQALVGDDSAEKAYTISSVTAPIITPPPPEVAPYIPAGLADRQPIIPPAPRKDEQSLLSGSYLTQTSPAPLADLPESVEDSGVFLTEKPQEKSPAAPATQRPIQPAMEPKLVISESTRFMARLNQRLSEAEKKLSNRCDQSRDRLIRELEALVDESRKIERQNELATGGLTERLIANLVKVTADVKARIAKSATESREALRDVIQSAEESVSELNSELTQELDSIEEKFNADSDVLTDKTRAALNQHAQDRITEYNRKVDEIANSLESVYKHHLGVMLTRFSKFETRLTEEVNAIISSLDRNVASMNVEIDGSWDRASEKLTSSQTEFANSVSFLVHSCKAEIKQVHLDAYASTVFPRLVENKDIFRAMLADMKRNFEEQSDKIRKQQVEGLSSTIDKARLELNTVTRESLSTIESVGKGQQFGLEELFNSTSKRLEDIIDIVESRLKTAKQEIVNNDEACMKASEASRVEDEPAFAKEKQQAIAALNDCRTKADNTLETSISSSCLNLEHFSEELQEDLAKQRADWTAQVRLTADESLMRVKQAIQDAFQSIETEKEKYME
ncbi:MAG: hypothetical protein K2X93_18105 [Candidatus Obscuribacterales bacterium]|nr:hypothetical protein [Candidatus Obscuribacterales bacterium]